MDLSIKRRRRRITVISTSPPHSVQSITAPKVLVARSYQRPRRSPSAVIISAHLSYAHVANIEPKQVVGNVRLVGRTSAPRAIILQTMPSTPSVIPPPFAPHSRPLVVQVLTRLKQLPTQAFITHAAIPIISIPHRDQFRPLVVKRPPDRFSAVRFISQPVIVSTRPGFIHSNFFNQPAHVVPAYQRRSAHKPIITHSAFVNRPIVLPYPKPIVVPRLIGRFPGRQSFAKTSKSIIISTRPIIVPRLVAKPGKLPRAIQQSLYTRQPIATIYSPKPPIVSRVIRRPLISHPSIIQGSTTSLSQLISPTRPIVVSRPVAKPRVRNPFMDWTGSGIKMIPVRNTVKMPRFYRQSLAMPAKSIVIGTHIPITDIPDPFGTFAFDIIAASIAWLRGNPTIVSTFGDNYALGIDKFTSDTEPRDTDPPYVVFYEPQEHDSFESKDPTGHRSAVTEGVYTIEVFSTGKLTTRQYSKLIGDYLSDAPLTFSEGVLIYIKAVDRQYPTLKAPGPGKNIVMFKRAVDFEYKFEKYIIGE